MTDNAARHYDSDPHPVTRGDFSASYSSAAFARALFCRALLHETENTMTHQIYAIEHRNIQSGEVALMEMDENVCYYIGEREPMERKAARDTRFAIRKGFPTRYRAVPLPYTTSLPDWFDYA
jgi:hypothetical protein